MRSSALLTGAAGMASLAASRPVSLPIARTPAISGNSRLLNGESKAIS